MRGELGGLGGRESDTKLTAHVWAQFPDTVPRLTEWIFEHMLDGVRRDYEHAMRELIHIKVAVERRLDER